MHLIDRYLLADVGKLVYFEFDYIFAAFQLTEGLCQLQTQSFNNFREAIEFIDSCYDIHRCH